MLPEYYLYVYDIVRDENRWVHKKYVEKYPKLYVIVEYKGKPMKNELLPQTLES